MPPTLFDLDELLETERKRSATLASTGLLDTEAEELFDRYVRVAGTIANSPISLISLLDGKRQWFKADKGLGERETPREWAFCDKAVRARQVFEVEDAAIDPMFADNPLVTGAPFIRHYAGAPLFIGAGPAIGTLCVIDQKPKKLTDEQRDALSDLAAILVREIETNHMAEIRADRAAAARAASVEVEHQMRNMFSKIGAIIDMAARESDTPEGLANAARRRIVALSQANEVSLKNAFAAAPMDQLATAALSHICASTGVTVDIEGDPIDLSPAAASVIAPLIDELVHDALRRGALSAGGAARLSWHVAGDEFHLDWSETGNCAGEAPQENQYLLNTAPNALRGSAERTCTESVRYKLRVPLALVKASMND